MSSASADPPAALPPAATGQGRRQVIALGVLLIAAAAILVVHSLRFNFVTDDAYISFVYAKNLAQHGQLVFNLGERVEGYTNFLWTVILALGIPLGILPEVSSRILGTLCGALGLLVAAWGMKSLRADAENAGGWSAWDAVPALMLAGIPGYACWSSGGLETQLFTLLVTTGTVCYLRAHLRTNRLDAVRRWLRFSALAFAGSALTRPEGYLFFGLLGLHRLFVRRRELRALLSMSSPELAAAGWFLLLTVPHLAFRRVYYGDWVPNTFYIKSSGGRAAWQQGAYYLRAVGRDLKLYVLPALYLFGLAIEETRRSTKELRERYLLAGVIGLLVAGPFALYVASVGGDFMGLYRFVMPVVPLLAIVGALGLFRLLRDVPLPAALAGTVAFFAAHAANTEVVDRHALSFIGADHGIDTPGYLRYYTEDRAAIGRWLGQHAQPDDYQVVGGAGAQVYFAGIRALDSFGLSDWYVAHRVKATSSRPGHQKFAPLDYVLSKKPTIITYNVYRIENYPYQPTYPEAAEWRERGFHFVSVEIPGLSRRYYTFLKRADRKLGPLPAIE